jgi:cytoskeletal protein CcmA (bactofilin family)
VSELKVGGSVKLRGPISFRVLDVAGSLSIEGDVEVEEDFKVSGSGKVKGRLKAKSIRAAGSLDVEGEVVAEEIDFSGSMKASAIKTGSLSVSGSLKSGMIEAREAEIHGSVKGDIRAVSVIIGKKSKVRGTIVADRVVVERRAEVERIIAREVVIEKDAEADYVEAEKAIVKRGAYVGELRYVKEYVAEEGAEIDRVTRIERLSAEAPRH